MMSKSVNIPIAIVATVTTALLTAGVVSSCGAKGQEPYKDAPVQGTHDRGAAKIIEMPDGFSNLATKCVGGVRYTVIYKGDDNRGSVSMLAGPNNGC
jgi:hypothetical protein